MIRIATFAVIFVTVTGQFQGQNFQAGQSFQPSTTPAPVHPPAQVHYVNIGQDLAGDYKFGYDTGKGPLGQSFREESRLPDGTVKGAYGYVDASGQQRIVRYTAGKDGFNIDEDTPAAAAAAKATPAPVQPQRAPAPQFQSFPQAQPVRFQHPSAPAQAPTAAPASQDFNPALIRQPAQLQNLPQNNAALQYRQYQQQAQAQLQAQAQAQQQAQLRQAQAPTYQSRPITPAQAQIANQLSASNPLSAFPQLPGVRLIQINPRQNAQQLPASDSVASNNFGSNNLAATSFGASGSLTSTPAPEEYTGPVVINAALLNYDIGSSRRN